MRISYRRSELQFSPIAQRKTLKSPHNPRRFQGSFYQLSRFGSESGQEIRLDSLGHGRVIQIRDSAFVPGGPEYLVYNIAGIALAQFLFQRVADEGD
jgi:hypothetical protein